MIYMCACSTCFGFLSVRKKLRFRLWAIRRPECNSNLLSSTCLPATNAGTEKGYPRPVSQPMRLKPLLLLWAHSVPLSSLTPLFPMIPPPTPVTSTAVLPLTCHHHGEGAHNTEPTTGRTSPTYVLLVLQLMRYLRCTSQRFNICLLWEWLRHF